MITDLSEVRDKSLSQVVGQLRGSRMRQKFGLTLMQIQVSVDMLAHLQMTLLIE